MNKLILVNDQILPPSRMPVATLLIRGEKEGLFIRRTVHFYPTIHKPELIELVITHLTDINVYAGMNYHEIEKAIADVESDHTYTDGLHMGWFHPAEVRCNTWCEKHNVSEELRGTLFWALSYLSDENYMTELPTFDVPVD